MGRSARHSPSGHERAGERICGVLIDAVSGPQTLAQIDRWAAARQSSYVCLANVHSVVTSNSHPQLKEALDRADLALPDGFPIAFMMRRLGHPDQRRISGPDLMWSVLRRCEAEERSVLFFGSTDTTLAKLVAVVRAAFPRLTIAGAISPPFRPTDTAFRPGDAAEINAASPDIVFVGLGCPKQEIWMCAARGLVHAPMLGVGAAFDYHAGTLARAPAWARDAGLEWLHRLCQEPGRLWKRYLVTNSLFLRWAFLRILGLER